MSVTPHENKKEFQIERMILFTDAVFAIAITLLVIEIKAPEIHHDFTLSDIINQLLGLVPRFIGFLISFFVIAIYWRSHHRLFSFISNYDEKLIWLNFIFLFTIILMPFSSAYYSENFEYHIPFYFYSLNIAITGFFNYRLLNYIIKKEGVIADGFNHPNAKKLALWRTLTVPGIFVLGILICLLLPAHYKLLSRYTPILIWPAMALLNRFFGASKYLEFRGNPPVKRKRAS